MTRNLHAQLERLLALSAENEVVEFKEAKHGYDFHKLGKYFSALCNEANLKGVPVAWLVFGVNDQRQVVGSAFRPARKDLDSLKEEIANRVQLTLTGKVLDMDYARVLARDGSLDLRDSMALDKVQKRQALEAGEEQRLKSRGLIEGRKPNYFIARSLAQQMGQKAAYSKNLAFDKQYYLDLIRKAVKEHGTLSRQDIDELLWNKLPDWRDDKQRKAKVGNLLTELRRSGKIVNRGSFAHPVWALLNAPAS